MTCWIIQVYDENGQICKEPRYIKGTEEEVKKYINERFDFVDIMLGRTTRYHELRKKED